MNYIQTELQKQTSILEKVQYESKKLNAQIEVQNKIIDSQNEELISLRETDTKLPSKSGITTSSNEIRTHIRLRQPTDLVFYK